MTLKAQNIRPIFLTQPLLYDNSPQGKKIVGWEYSNIGEHGLLSAATHAQLLDFFNEELIRVRRDEHVEVVDLASIVPHSEKYFYDSMHFTERGAQFVAEEVAQYLRDQKQSVGLSGLCTNIMMPGRGK